MKTIKLKPIQSIKGGSILGGKGEALDVKGFLDLFLFQIPANTLTLEDSVRAQSYFLQVGGQNGNKTLKLEDNEYKWVQGKIEKYAHLVAGLNAIKVKEAWEDIVEDKGSEKAE